MPADRIEPDRPPGEEAAGTGGIGIIQHALELVAGRAAGKQHPWDAARRADLAHGVKLALGGRRPGTAVAWRQRVRRQRTLEFQKIDAIFRLGEFAHAFDDELRQFARRFYIIGGVTGAAEEWVD